MRWLVLVVVAGCYAPSPYTSCTVTCATDPDCPTGQSCFAGRCSARAGQCALDASVDGLDPKEDADDDGILNGEDKCPTVKSPGNYDHDGDSTGDPCDPCPHMKGTIADHDSDGDGVGDGCDLHPDIPGESRGAFYGFYAASEIATWTKQGDYTVNLTTERLVADNLALGGGYIELPDVFGPNLQLWTAAHITITATDPAFDKHVGISTHRDAIGYHSCQLQREGTLTVIRHRVYTGTNNDLKQTYAGTFVARHELEMLQDGGNMQCSVDTQPLARAIAPGGGRVGLDVSFVHAELEYLFIVKLP